MCVTFNINLWINHQNVYTGLKIMHLTVVRSRGHGNEILGPMKDSESLSCWVMANMSQKKTYIH
jgi:hypothetical protein